MPSPNKDWGYDVADFTGVHPELGTMEDLEELISVAGERGIRILLDLVPNHTSDQHPWFQDALSGPGAEHRDWYVWADPGPDGGPPNNWLSVFRGEPAWELDEASGQYYLHNFLSHQPDLNWWNDDVRAAFDDILRFWFDKGVAGFRIDVAHSIIKDRELRDNPPTDDMDHAEVRRLGQKQLYNMNRPEGHDVIKRWRDICESYDPARILVGETYVLELEQLAAFYGGGGDELNLAFNFPFVFSDFTAEQMSKVVDDTNAAIPSDAWPVWMGSNHDVGRFPTRWCGDDERKARLALMLLLTLRGTAFLYYGDEVGARSVELPRDQLKDPVGIRHYPEDKGRDHCRTPMRWDGSATGGFSDSGDPWLPLGDDTARNVEAQRAEPSSVLNLTRALIQLRRERPELSSADHETEGQDDGLWAYRRGGLRVVLNMSDRRREIETAGRVLLSTDRAGEGETLQPGAVIEPWSGLIVEPAGS